MLKEVVASSPILESHRESFESKGIPFEINLSAAIDEAIRKAGGSDNEVLIAQIAERCLVARLDAELAKIKPKNKFMRILIGIGRFILGRTK